MDAFAREIEVHAPVEFCYELWRDYLHHPIFMPNVQSVRYLSQDVWRWVLIGPNGDAGTWDAQLVKEIPDRLISWKSISGPEFEMWIDTSFFKIAPERSLVIVVIEVQRNYLPLLKLFEELYALTPELVTKNLQAFKAYVEARYHQAPVTYGWFNFIQAQNKAHVMPFAYAPLPQAE